MQRRTHIAIGAAAAAPIALGLDPAPAVAALALGMTGGVTPDFLDLHSDARGVLRHRGFSHSLLLAVALVAGVNLLLTGLARALGQESANPDRSVLLLTGAYAAGLASHLIADACTRAGIQPLLPFSRRRVWLLPGPLRSRSSGPGDRLARLAALVILVAFAGAYISR